MCLYHDCISLDSTTVFAATFQENLIYCTDIEFILMVLTCYLAMKNLCSEYIYGELCFMLGIWK